MPVSTSIPTYLDLMYPVLQAVRSLGGSGASREISAAVVEAEGFSDDLLAVTYEGREKSILMDRLDWARSYCKLGGVLESPRRGLFLVTELGREIAELPEDDARTRLKDIDRTVRQSRSERRKDPDGGLESADEQDDEIDGDGKWREVLLTRLHELTPDAFEHFVLYVLRSQGMKLKRVGGSGDEGIDGIGTAPIGNVLTTTVAVQAKRIEPSKAVGRDIVALFQSDAHAAGAEHGVLVTTGRFSGPAEKAALGRHPTVDLIDGERLAELCLENEIGISLDPVVSLDFFSRFENL